MRPWRQKREAYGQSCCGCEWGEVVVIVRRKRADAGHREPKEDDKAGSKHIRKVSRHGWRACLLWFCGKAMRAGSFKFVIGLVKLE